MPGIEPETSVSVARYPQWRSYIGVFYVVYYVYLCSVLCVFNSIIFLIFIVARYLKAFGIFVSKYLTAFSVSIINARHQNIKTEINKCKFLYRTLYVKKNLV